MFDKIHSFVSAIAIAIVAIVSFMLELPVKVFFFMLTTALYLIAVLFAPLTRNIKATYMTDALIDYAWSFKFIIVNAVVDKYKDALGW